MTPRPQPGGGRPVARRYGARLHRDVAPGIHRLEHAAVNCYLVEDAGRVTVVDAGLPRTWPHLLTALEVLGRTVGDIDALLLTHAHFDHLGFARRLVEEGVPVYLHAADHRLARHPYRYRKPKNPLQYPIRYPSAVPALAAMARAGALAVPPVPQVRPLVPGEPLSVAGAPVALFTPGHTDGHCAFVYPARNAVIVGDALVTLDPYTGRTGPRLVARAATADPALAAESLAAIAGTGAAVVLPGHGEPWTTGAAAAVAAARAEPIA